MKVHLIKRQTVEDYAVQHARSRSSFALWLTAVKYADWNTPADIQQTFGAADLLGEHGDFNKFVILKTVADNRHLRVGHRHHGQQFWLAAVSPS